MKFGFIELICVCAVLMTNLSSYTKSACSGDVASLQRASQLRQRQTAARRLLGSVTENKIMKSDALIRTSVTTGQEFVTALANPSVSVIRLAVPSVTVTPEDWNSSGIGLPIHLRRNVTLEGSGEWPQLNLKYVRNVVRLGGTVRMTFSNMYVYMEGLLGKSSRLAGTDIFAPTDQTEPPSEVWFVSAAMYTPYCFAGYLHALDVIKIPRPAQYPGPQGEFVDVDQTGCVNEPTAAPLQRCWADKSYVQDWAFEGIDIDPFTSAVRHSNMLYRFLNNTAVCQFQVDPACTNLKDPMVCYGETVKNSNNNTSSGGRSNGSYAASSPTVSRQPSNSTSNGGELQPSGPSGNISDFRVALPAGPGSADGSGTRTAVIIGATVGAAILASMATVVVIGWRRRHHRRCAKPGPVTGTESTCVESGGGGLALAVIPSSTAVGGENDGYICDSIPIVSPSAGGPQHEEPLSQIRKQELQAVATCCKVSMAALADMASGVAPPVTHKTPPASNIPFNVALVQLRPKQSTTATSGSGIDTSSASMVPPVAATAPRGGEILTEPAAQEGRQQVTLRVIGGAKAAAAAGLEVINEHAPLQGPNGDDLVAVAASGGGGGGGGNAAIQQDAADYTGGHGVPHHLLKLPRVNIALDDAVMVPEGYTSSSYDLLTAESSESGSGEGNAMVGLLPVVLGKGTFGRVVEGRYKGRRVAVKLMASEEPWTDVPASSFDQAFAQEVEVLSRCTHPNVVRLLAARVTPPRLCLVMELMDASLEWLIHHNAYQPEMPMPKVLHIGICVANALAYLHPTIVHRDLKPSNVLVNNPQSDKPTVKLSDFGLSRLWTTVGSTEHPDAGTPAYMAPECFDVTNQRITHQADIFSLGVLIWEMLAMTRPWKETGPVAVAFMVTYKGVRPPLTCLSDSRCPPKLARLLEACWEADPERRPAAAEVAKELTLVLQEVGHTTRRAIRGAGESTAAEFAAGLRRRRRREGGGLKEEQQPVSQMLRCVATELWGQQFH
ncbi:hypothetical protein Vafri_13124 [Volvox africanus]|uniref:Protein kinase domain-containing protein n=1 Tax=Volvox africanus TaxID=51714 RepID=A0A8J4BFT3_9CHLO|nr:hypothetical protein Vafri_13124 [Volvox africanus]